MGPHTQILKELLTGGVDFYFGRRGGVRFAWSGEGDHGCRRGGAYGFGELGSFDPSDE